MPAGIARDGKGSAVDRTRSETAFREWPLSRTLADGRECEFAFLRAPVMSAPAYRKSPSASALRALNAATQIGKSPNILGIVPPFAPRIELP